MLSFNFRDIAEGANVTDFFDHTGEASGGESQEHSGLTGDVSGDEATDSASFFTEWQLDHGDGETATLTD